MVKCQNANNTQILEIKFKYLCTMIYKDMKTALCKTRKQLEIQYFNQEMHFAKMHSRIFSLKLQNNIGNFVNKWSFFNIVFKIFSF